MRLVSIENDRYSEYRLEAIFDCYKWDPMFIDNNTLAKYILVITKEEHEKLKELTEMLDKETIESERYLNNNIKLTKKLNLPKKLYKELKKMNNYDPNKHVRLMRYDFHPTIENKWAVSEVNSDVPGGYAEASLLPKLACKLFEEPSYFIDFGNILTEAISKKVVPNGTIMLIHCTCYSDDRQVMQFLGDKLKSKGFNIIYAAADHLRFINNEATSILSGNEGKIDFVFRFTPLEWLKDIKPKKWSGYFNSTTPCCNHPIAIYCQTKRFPLIWDKLEKAGIKLSVWKELLPETIEVKNIKNKQDFIYKPACGRVGEKISIKEACLKDEYKKIIKDVKRHPRQYIAQKKFESKPLIGQNNEKYHVCLGSYTVDGKHAGYYARISKSPRIDSLAADIPVIIEGSK